MTTSLYSNSKVGFPAKRNASNEFTQPPANRKLGTELSSFQLNSSF